MNLICPIESSLNRYLDEEAREQQRAEWIDARTKEILDELLSKDGYKFNSAKYGISDVLEKIANESHLTYLFEDFLLKQVVDGRAAFFINRFIQLVAEQIAKQFAADELAAMESDYDN